MTIARPAEAAGKTQAYEEATSFYGQPVRGAAFTADHGKMLPLIPAWRPAPPHLLLVQNHASGSEGKETGGTLVIFYRRRATRRSLACRTIPRSHNGSHGVVTIVYNMGQLATIVQT